MPPFGPLGKPPLASEVAKLSPLGIWPPRSYPPSWLPPMFRGGGELASKNSDTIQTNGASHEVVNSDPPIFLGLRETDTT